MTQENPDRPFKENMTFRFNVQMMHDDQLKSSYTNQKKKTANCFITLVNFK